MQESKVNSVVKNITEGVVSGFMDENKWRSKLDDQKTITSDKWAITLIRNDNLPFLEPRHVQIIIEGIKDNKFFIHMWHLNARKDISSGLPWGMAPIEFRYLTEKKILYQGKSKTYLVKTKDVERMIKDIKKDHENRVPFGPFGIFGQQSILNIYGRYSGNPNQSCFTWAAHKLYVAGLKIENVHNQNSVKLFIDSFSDASETADFITSDKFGVIDLAYFAKRGDNESIESFFIPSLNKNNNPWDRLIQLPEGGSVESFLGYYTPLSLAVSYNYILTVKLLINKYDANPNKLSGRLSDHTALDCAKRRWANDIWPLIKTLFFGGGREIDKEIELFLISKGAKKSSELANKIEFEMH